MSLATLLRGGTQTVGSTPPPDPSVDFTQYMVVGDSMSNGSGSGSVAAKWTEQLNDLCENHTGTRPATRMFGFGGTRVGSHAQFQGGKKMTVTVAGGQIPTSGAVVLTPAESEFDLGEDGLAAHPNFVLAGVTGTIRRGSGAHSQPITFTRAVNSSSPTPAAGSQILTHTPGETYRNVPLLAWSGHNNREDGMPSQYWPGYALSTVGGLNYVTTTHVAMGAYNTDPDDRWAFLGLSSGPSVPYGTSEHTALFGSDGYGGAIGAMRAAVGVDHWIDVRAGLISNSLDPDVSAYAYSGITRTAADNTAVAGRYPGPSLRATNDQVGHLNQYGQAWVAKCVMAFLVAQGWLG